MIDGIRLPRRAVLKAALAAPLISGTPALAAAPTPGLGTRRFVTHHVAMLGGRPTRYTVEAADTLLADAAGRPAAAMFGFSYLRDARESGRPVFFLFGGGPGGDSDMWHLRGLAPKRILADGTSGFRLIDNHDSLLDVADLVFIDPISAGYSRALPGVPNRDYWGLLADAESFAQFIQSWLRTHDRLGAPLYIGGVSYGTVRAATLSHRLHQLGIPLAGVLLDSCVISYASTRFDAGNDLPYVLFMPSYATVHWHHRMRNSGVSLPDHAQRAAAFALDRLHPVILQGRRASPERVAQVAVEMSGLIGLDARYLIDAQLRVPSETFMRDYGATLGRALDRADGRKGGGGEAANVIAYRDMPPFFQTPFGTVAQRYFQDDLGITMDDPYVSLALVGGSNWDTNEPGKPRQPFDNVDMAAGLAEDMRGNPTLRIMLVEGYFDLATPWFAAQTVLATHGLVRERVTSKLYPSGHGVLRDDVAGATYRADLRTFVRGG